MGHGGSSFFRPRSTGALCWPRDLQPHQTHSRSWLLQRESGLITLLNPLMCVCFGLGDPHFLGEAHVNLREVK